VAFAAAAGEDLVGAYLYGHVETVAEVIARGDELVSTIGDPCAAPSEVHAELFAIEALLRGLNFGEIPYLVPDLGPAGASRASRRAIGASSSAPPRYAL
jgi:hypothetical protein